MSTTMTGPRGLVLPRFGTPRNPDLPTRGHEVAAVAERLHLPMMPWGRHVVDVLYEYDPDTGINVYDTGDLFVMRQVGKTLGVMTPMMVHRSTMAPNWPHPKRNGTLGRQRTTFTMHKRDKARQKLERDIAPLIREAPESFLEIKNPKARPGRSTREWKISLNNGGEHLLFGRGNYLQIDTPSKQAAHSDTLDACFFDEIRFAIDDRVEQGAKPTMLTRANRMFIRSSTAGDHESFYMWPLVVSGRAQCETGSHGRRAYFEWSIPEDADLWDPDAWWEHHPALGHTIDLEDIFAELRAAESHPDESKMDAFRQEYANQWIRHPVIGDGPREFVIDPEVWHEREVSPSTPFTGATVLGVGVADDGRSAALGLAGWNSAGYGQVKVLDLQPGTFWIEQAIAAAIAAHDAVAVAYDAGGPTNAIAGPIARAAGTTPIEAISGRQYASACAGFVTGFEEGRYRHMAQEWLDSAVFGARKKQRGESWLWDLQHSVADVTPLPALTCALRALEGRPPERRSAYEVDDAGLVAA